MPGTTTHSAVLLLVIGNALAVISDVFVKVIGEGAPVFQFIFIRSVLTLALLAPFWRHFNRKHFFEGLGLHLLRSHMLLLGVFCMVIALTTLPLATANAVFYVAPVIVMLLSVLVFRERLTWLSLVAVVGGFAGIIVILRPVEFQWSAFSALGAAVSLAVAALMVRMLPTRQGTLHRLFLNYLLLLPASAALMLWEGAPPRPDLLVSAVGSAVFILGYNTSVLLAYRHVAANRVTSAEYTGLLWAVVIGWLWFNEVPDGWFALGSAMIILPLVALSLQSTRRRYSQ